MAGQGIFWHTSYVMSSQVFIILVALTVISQHGISMYLSCWNDVGENTTEYLWEKSPFIISFWQLKLQMANLNMLNCWNMPAIV